MCKSRRLTERPTDVSEEVSGGPGTKYPHRWRPLDNAAQETAFFTQILGTTRPWFISKVILHKKNQRGNIYVDHSAGSAFPYPECQRLCFVYDHTKERVFRRLNVCQMASFVHDRLPRIKCFEHGVKQNAPGLGEEHCGMTYEFESLVIDLQKECSIESVCRLLDIGSNESLARESYVGIQAYQEGNT